MKILITGAHLTPAVAVIEKLKEKPNIEIVYIGRKTTLEGDRSISKESTIFPQLGVKFRSIIAGRLQRSFTLYTLPSLFKIPVGFAQALFILIIEKPDVILSFGGYVAVPVVVAGWLLSIPIIIHEQSLTLGLANKVSAFFADKIAVSFQPSGLDLRKVILTGNPIRQEILSGSHLKSHSGLPRILIMGGNQGAHMINVATEDTLDQLTKIAKVIHITGDNKYRDFDRLVKRKSQLGKLENRYEIYRWRYQDLGQILQKIDLVVCRSGINTLTELAFLGIPTLVIPLPFLNEQNLNAKFFETLGLAKILPQSKLNGKSLLQTIKSMLKDLDHLITDAKKARRVVIADAAQRLALETMILGQYE